MIKLDIGGIKFTTKIETLMKIPYFTNGLNDSELTEKIFVDRSGFIFDHVLSWARDDNYLFPEKHKLELDFYGVDCSLVKFRESVFSKISSLEMVVTPLLTRIDDLENDIKHNFIAKEEEWMCIFPGCSNNNEGDNYCANHYDEGVFCDKRGCFNHTDRGVRYCFKHKSD